MWSGNIHLDDGDTFVETYSDLNVSFAQRNTPRAPESIVECVSHPVGPAVPDLDCAILATAGDDREVGVEYSG